MKKSIILTILFTSCTLCGSFAQHSTTFMVDKHLSAPKEHLYTMDGNTAVWHIVSDYQAKELIDLRVSEVPEVFKQFKHVYDLSLNFTGKVVIPKWMDDIKFDRLMINGKMTEDEVKELKVRFPDAQIQRED